MPDNVVSMFPTIAPLLAGLTVVLVVLGLFRSNRPAEAVMKRVEQYGIQPDPDDPYEGSVYERAIGPAVRWFVARLSAVAPSRLTEDIAEQLEIAGASITPARFLALWVSLAVLAPVALMVVLMLFGVSGVALIPIAVLMLLGLYAPWYMLRRRGKARRTEIDRTLPDAIDLIVTCVQSGLGLQAAMMKVSDSIGGPVGDEFRRASREVGIGRSREEALTAMAERSHSHEMKLFVRAIVQAERMGISVGAVLRNQSQEIRERRQQKAREKANTIPVKITIPTVLFIFPTLFLLILGPVALNLMEMFRG